VDDLLEAGVADPLVERDARARVAADLARRREEGVDPLLGVVLVRQRAVFRVVLQVKVLELGPAAGVEVAFEEGGQVSFLLQQISEAPRERLGRDALVDVADQLGPIGDAGGHVAAEDEVEWDVVEPGAFDIIDLKLDVWRNPGDHAV
jgi:hypothetical protein